MTYNYMLRMALLDTDSRVVLLCFLRGKDKRSEGELSRLSIIGDIPDSFKPKTLSLTVTTFFREGPEKVGSFYSKTLTLITETGQK